MNSLTFTKMHWAGNDFIVLDATNDKLKGLDLSPEFIQKISHRQFWIWFDQLLVILDSTIPEADFKYQIFNADGWEVEMCGNGVRCFVKYAVEKALTDKKEISVETMSGIIKPKYEESGLVSVDMWAPILDRPNIPVAKNESLIASEDKEFEFIPVSMWNPHAVIFWDEVTDLSSFDVKKYWKPIENNIDYFPNRINVEFIKVVNSREIEMRVWERWTWETLACGTWACAAVVAWIIKGYLDKWEDITVKLLGWELIISWSWNEKDSVIMQWPAESVFEGEYKF